MKQIYWYEFIHRGLSIGCQPKGFVDHDESKGKFGWVAYDRELTEKEIIDYELKPVKQSSRAHETPSIFRKEI